MTDNPSNSSMMAMMNFNHYKLDRFELSLPKYDSRIDNRTVSLVTDLRSLDDIIVGRVEVIISFDEFIDKVITAP